jgi:hypothetical protein
MCAIIAMMSLGVVVDVVNGRAWNKAIMWPWSLNRSYLIFDLLEYVD